MVVHLRTHSHFSIRRALPSPLALAERAGELGMAALALTDYNSLAGAIRFYIACQDRGIKPLIGCELELAAEASLVLLARNMTGYSNLCRLLSENNLASPGGVGSISLGSLAGRNDGLFCLVPDLCAHKGSIEELKAMFPHSLYALLENHLARESPQKIHRQSEQAHYFGLPLATSNNVHFLRGGDWEAREVLLAIGERRPLQGQSRHRLPGREFYLKSAAEMQELFCNHPAALRATVEIAEDCNLELPLGSFHFPDFAAPDGKDNGSFLSDICYLGMNRLYSGASMPEERLRHELTVIGKLGFTEYFLAVWDIVQFARREQIRYSCRGSAAGSLVAYCLGITAVDPVANNLLFERFLNSERRGMPDIDLDFDSARRDEVLAYVYQRYDQEKVAMVGTVNTFNARSALREAAQVLGFSKAEISRLARFIPHIPASRLAQAIDTLPELKGFPRSPRYRRLIEVCSALDGCPRHFSVHAGGVVISRDPLTELVPLQWSPKGVVITQYDKDDLEALGLVKMDLLGLRILSAIENTVTSLRHRGIVIDTESLPLDDSATYGLLRSTATVGVFQLESPGMRELLARLQPDRFADIVANIALFRPGPMQANMIAPYLKRRHGEEESTYVHPCLEPILAETYGVIVFQEQVLQIAAAMGKFSLGQADILRRTMTKDCPKARLLELRADFVAGAVSLGIEESAAEDVFTQLSAFAAYGFNKAHAASFGLLAYQSAYLKAHYPAEFYAALLNFQPMGFYPAGTVLHDARNQGISLQSPDILLSPYEWEAKEGILCMGLKEAGSMSQEQFSLLRVAREAGLHSAEEALSRLKWPERLWQSLLSAGALDSLGSREEWNRQLSRHRNRAVGAHVHQCSLFETIDPLSENADTAVTPPALQERLYEEFRVTGMCYSAHPMDLWADAIESLSIKESDRLPFCADGEQVRVAGIVVSRQTPPTRSGQRILFLTLEDRKGLIDVAVFPGAQQEGARTALGGGLLLIDGILRKTGVCGLSLTAKKVRRLGTALTV